MEQLTKLIREDMKPALGVTEPGAIAFAAATAKAQIGGEVTGVSLRLNSGMYKNAFTWIRRRGWRAWGGSPRSRSGRPRRW